MSENLIKYEAILRDYRNGVYGKEHLTLHEILQRANAEKRKASFQMVIDDVYAIGKGRLVGRPKY